MQSIIFRSPVLPLFRFVGGGGGITAQIILTSEFSTWDSCYIGHAASFVYRKIYNPDHHIKSAYILEGETRNFLGATLNSIAAIDRCSIHVLYEYPPVNGQCYGGCNGL